MYSVVDDAYSAGLPHSDILGSQLVLSSPRLFAEYHVLLRLSLPRHPPDALLFLILTMCMCDLIITPISLELFMSYSYPLYKLIFICKYSKDLIYGLLIHILVTLPIHLPLTTP